MVLRTASALVVIMASVSINAQDRNFDIARNLEILHEVFRETDMFYVDTLDVDKVVKKGIDAMLSSLDPYTVYYPEEEEDDVRQLRTGMKYAGIGAMIRQYVGRDYVMIEEPYENSPASKAGVKAGDLILRIDGESMKGRQNEYVSNHLRGDADTKFILTVKREGVEDSIDIEITRDYITFPAVPYYGMHGNVGYLTLDGFTENCSREVRTAVLDLLSKGAKALVLDLRGNGGGLLNEAVEIVSMFVPKGTMVVETKGKMRQATEQFGTRRDPIDKDIPLAVLVDDNSASASEIVAGALQDLDRAVIVGQRTFGKGLVQATRELSYNSNLKVTTAKYYIPSGRCVQAIDYSNDKARTPDSLTNVFHTKNGREVRDGGGIRPDIECKLDTMPDILYYLTNDVVTSDFLNHYCAGRESIPAVKDFSVSDSLFDAFKEFVKASDFKFESRSSRMLESLRELAALEGLAPGAKAEFDALETKLQYDMERDLDTFETDLKKMLATAIITRYWFQRGAIEESLKTDPVFEAAVKALSDSARLKQLLGR